MASHQAVTRSTIQPESLTPWENCLPCSLKSATGIEGRAPPLSPPLPVVKPPIQFPSFPSIARAISSRRAASSSNHCRKIESLTLCATRRRSAAICFSSPATPIRPISLHHVPVAGEGPSDLVDSGQVGRRQAGLDHGRPVFVDILAVETRRHLRLRFGVARPERAVLRAPQCPEKVANGPQSRFNIHTLVEEPEGVHDKVQVVDDVIEPSSLKQEDSR